MTKINVQIIGNAEMLNPLLDYNQISANLFEDEIEALNYAALYQPPVILLGYSICTRQTPEYIGYLLNESESSRIIIVDDQLGDDQIMACIIAGAQGYLEINDRSRFLNKAIKVVYAGEAWVARKMVPKVLDKLRVEMRQAVVIQ